MEQKEANEKIIPRQLLLWITIVLVVGLVLLSLFSIYFVFIYPENQVSQLGITNVTEKANFINQTRTTFISFFVLFAQILGGGAVAIGIYFGWGNLKVALATLESNQNKARDELKLAQDTLEANIKNAQKSLEIAQEGQITERFTRAVDQLGAVDKDGNPAIEIRLGGIYALERIANESEKDYWPIMEILTAYVRKNSSTEVVRNAKDKSPVHIDIQAVLMVLGRRKRHFNDNELNHLNLRVTCLQKADLTDAHFEGADLTDAHLERAVLRKAHLEGANLTGVHLERAHLNEAILTDVYLEGAHLHGANLLEAHLEGADLREANLDDAIFFKAHLEGANLWKAHLEIAFLRMAHLNGAFLTDALLRGADLTEAHLEKAHLEGANLMDANLGGADLTEAHLEGAKNLTIDQLSEVKTLHGAKLDEELRLQLQEKCPDLFEKTVI
jgi:uncharacterized protein YjbI with pentapeptide repeats